MAKSGAALNRLSVVSCRLTVVLLCAATAAGQQPISQPRFEIRAEVILVDVTVLDRDGQPVGDLTAKDFVITVNGTPRTVQTAQFISTNAARAAANAATMPTEASPASAAATTPSTSTGRHVLFAVDENYLRVGAGHEVITRATRILDTLAPGDQVAFARLPGGTGGVEFTTDREPIRDALAKIMGNQPPQTVARVSLAEAAAFRNGGSSVREEVIKRECGFAEGLALEICLKQIEADASAAIYDGNQRTSNSIRALEGLLERLASLGTPTNLVLFSEGLFVNTDRHDLRRLERLAAEARVTFHIIQIDQSNVDRDKPEVFGANAASILGEGLEQIAGSTGGSVYRVSTSGIGIMDRIARALGGYYLLSFEPTDADRAGRAQQMKVEVRRPGLEVRARRSFALAGAAAAPMPASAPPRDRLEELLSASAPTTSVPIRVATYAMPDPAGSGKVRVIVAAELAEPADATFRLLVVDKNNAPVLNAAPSKGSALLQSMTLAPGDYSLRVAALTADDRAGSVHHKLYASLLPLTPDGRISASDLIVAPATADGTTRPTASGVIDTDIAAIALELTGSDTTLLASASVMIEIAESTTGPALLKGIAPLMPRSTATLRAFGAGVNIAAFPPREYVARAIVSLPGEASTTISRRFTRVTR